MGTLFVVATPIGNLDDITLRAIRVLRDVSLIAAEDTRHTAKLLRRLDIDTPAISLHQHNERQRVERIVSALAEGDVAMVSDAGTPAVSDPGAVMVRAVQEAGHVVSPIPGASSLAAAVSASGLVGGPFTFLGFLPRSGDERRLMLARAAWAGMPTVVFESPNRLVRTLGDFKTVFGNVEAVVARELTKLHEELRYGTLSELQQVFGDDGVRGEICIVIDSAETDVTTNDTESATLAKNLLASGIKPSKAARELSRITGMSGSEAYEIVREAGDHDRENVGGGDTA
jgi:16S rRNA (cytidine1402-2'-O)-methyltransferase